MPHILSQQLKDTKYIFVTGGVASSLGKGIISASLAKLLQARAYAVTIQKLDPYLNIDPGTLNPYEHGECYVTNDGAETDLDLGHYERFLNAPTSQNNNITSGRIYRSILDDEREGRFLGKTVQVIPHVTNEIKNHIKRLAKSHNFDIVITEIGGTVGDIESLPYVEAVRQFKYENPQNTLFIHLTLVPYLSASGELKTKPTQHSVKMLLENGIQPDILVLRTEHSLPSSVKEKVALFCNVQPRSVIQAKDVKTIYEVPIKMQQEGLDTVVLDKLKLPQSNPPPLTDWKEFLAKLKAPQHKVKIGLVGKYVELKDSYKSIIEALVHGGTKNSIEVEIHWVHSKNLLANVSNQLKGLNGILVAPGFGERDIEGKINAVQYAREAQIPFLGICLGMQVAVIEFCRHILKLPQAGSREFNEKVVDPVIDLMEDQKKVSEKGGTMRLGAYECTLQKGSKAREAYHTNSISERHRHRYEVNSKYLTEMEKHGMISSGINEQTGLTEIVEIPNHPWFVGVQYHPEYKSTVLNPHPLFVSFIEAARKTL